MTLLTLRRTKLYDFFGVASAAAPSVWPSLSAEIPMLVSDWFEASTSTAGLPPNAISEFTTGVNPLVLNVGDKLEV